jgi:glutathione S-transferase
MAEYRLFGAETSPYSLKVRSALRYKGIDFEWIARSASNEAEFRKSAATPTVPLLISPAQPPAQDSTLILAALERTHPEPAARPEAPAAAGLAMILEDYGDEWLSKCMFQQRWGQQPDRDAAALRVLQTALAEDDGWLMLVLCDHASDPAFKRIKEVCVNLRDTFSLQTSVRGDWQEKGSDI